MSAALLAAFALWTLAICRIDVSPIGPEGSEVGFASLNSFIHELFGVHMTLYAITDWLGLVPLAFGLGFALLGLWQWIGRKHILRVDRSLLILGGFYFIVLSAYLLFEICPINYRPIMINGVKEASYPSSTTLLVLCIMPTAIMQLNARIGNRFLRRSVTSVIITFTAFMVIGRLFSGVHWFTDIVGGALLSGGLVSAYKAMIGIGSCNSQS